MSPEPGQHRSEQECATRAQAGAAAAGAQRSTLDILYSDGRWGLSFIGRYSCMRIYKHTAEGESRILRWEFIFVRDISYYVRILYVVHYSRYDFDGFGCVV